MGTGAVCLGCSGEGKRAHYRQEFLCLFGILWFRSFKQGSYLFCLYTAHLPYPWGGVPRPPWMLEAAGSSKPCISYMFPIHTSFSLRKNSSASL